MSLPVNVLPSSEARKHLGSMLDRFRHGHREPMFFGAHRRPEAVVLAYEDYLALLEGARVAIAHDEEADVAEIRRRITAADANPGEPVESIEAFAESLGELGAEWAAERRAAANSAVDAAADHTSAAAHG